MKVKVLEIKKNKLEIELEGETHTLANLLREALHRDKDVKVASYVIDHPYLSNPRLYLVCKEDAKEALLRTIKSLRKQIKEFEKEFNNELQKNRGKA